MLARRSAQSRLKTTRPLVQDVCCEGNTYRSSLVSSHCEDCPDGSTSNLGGYYCEANPSTDENPNPSTGSNRKLPAGEKPNHPSGEKYNPNPSTDDKEHHVFLHGVTHKSKRPQKGRVLYTGRKIGWPKGHPNPSSGEEYNRNPSTDDKEHHSVLLHGATHKSKRPQNGRVLHTGRKIRWPKGRPIKGKVRHSNI